MIDAHLVAKDAAQALCNLGGEGNLRQQIKHLLPFLQAFVDEVNVYLGLSRRGDTMQQGYILLGEGFFDALHGLLLDGAEGAEWGCLCFGAVGVGGASLFVFLLEGLLVFGLHGTRQGGFHHVSQRADVVACHPLPEAELQFVDGGLLVKHFYDALELNALRSVAVQGEHYAGVDFVFAEGHDHTAASPDLVL